MNRVDRQLPESPVGLVFAYDDVARQVTLGPPDEQQSLWSWDDHYRHTRTTIFRALAATGEHPDRCMYAIARFAFNPDNPRPIGGKRYPGYQKFKGVTPRDVLDWLMTVSLRPEWEVGRRRPPHPSTLITAVAVAVNDVLKLLNRREADGGGGGGASRGRRGGGRVGEDKEETMDNAVLVGMKKAGHVARDQTYLPSHVVNDRVAGGRKAAAARDDIAKLWDGLINDPSGTPVGEVPVRTQTIASLPNIFAGPSKTRERRLSATSGLTGGARHGSSAVGTGSLHPLSYPRVIHHSHSSLGIPAPNLDSDGSTLHYVFYIEAPGNPLYGSGVLATPVLSAAELAGTRRKLGPSRILAEMIEMRDRSAVSLSIAVAARYVLLSPEGTASASSAPPDWLNWWRIADPQPAMDGGGHATGSGSGSGPGSTAPAASGLQQQPGAAFFTWQSIDDGPRAPWVATSLLLQECDAITRKWLQARLEVELLKLRMCEDMIGEGFGEGEVEEEQEEMKRSDRDDIGEVP
ncbi:hypothetical protein HK101_002274 [Irineochytrium annulatum]|nr:hypothetical protein HK101_002274 [Irineochytrium annulatum]